NRADRGSRPRIQANMSSYPAVYAEIYCLAKFIIYIYSFRAYMRRGGSGGLQTLMDGPLSHIARRKGTSR
ncbi:hypothetical protein CWN75_27680, partial [Klebsiella pneumoniae]